MIFSLAVKDYVDKKLVSRSRLGLPDFKCLSWLDREGDGQGVYLTIRLEFMNRKCQKCAIERKIDTLEAHSSRYWSTFLDCQLDTLYADVRKGNPL